MSSSGLPMADTKTLPTNCLESIHHPKRASGALDHGGDPQKCVHCQHIIACEIAVVCPPPDTAFRRVRPVVAGREFGACLPRRFVYPGEVFGRRVAQMCGLIS